MWPPTATAIFVAVIMKSRESMPMVTLGPPCKAGLLSSFDLSKSDLPKEGVAWLESTDLAFGPRTSCNDQDVLSHHP